MQDYVHRKRGYREEKKNEPCVHLTCGLAHFRLNRPRSFSVTRVCFSVKSMILELDSRAKPRAVPVSCELRPVHTGQGHPKGMRIHDVKDDLRVGLYTTR